MSELIQCAKRGDEYALGQLFHKHKRLIEWHAIRKWNMRPEEEDVSQRVFIRLPQTLSMYEYRGDRAFRSLLLTMTDQECIKMFRTWKRKVSPELALVEATNTAFFRKDENILLKLCVMDCLESLSLSYRCALLEWLENGEVSGKQTDASFEAQNYRLNTARRRFKEAWDPGWYKRRKRLGVSTGIRGQYSNRAVLTDDGVRQIRSLYSGGGWTIAAIARKMGVGETCVRDVVKRKKWTHVSD